MKTHHTTGDGTKIAIKDMSDNHLRNTIRYIRRRAAEGVTVEYGGFGIGDDEPWYDTDEVYGGEAEDLFELKAYIHEAQRRGLK